MSFFKRAHDIVEAKANRALDKHLQQAAGAPLRRRMLRNQALGQNEVKIVGTHENQGDGEEKRAL